MSTTLPMLNAMPEAVFVATLGTIFEHSPWVAAAVSARRPFASVADLHRDMCTAVAGSSPAQRLALIAAHPELGAAMTRKQPLSVESAGEQAGAGLDRNDAPEAAQLLALNARYRARFGMPFVLAVRGYDRRGIIDNLHARLGHSLEEESDECLRQIYRIARFRLDDLIVDMRQGLV
ncbi:2-oxo-4-hydroxy-4-carboxy-5-ureidoimidazoline decarboxylase [Robbsia sp. Bb-Pol-6]|uniref:2-oxo-4-hydroxy-4-carboxy-5-ureidoimidazoline decarboxylase n=1 Tax=Robbsia betulipollinis TaxID=2981849 RepID=A0ABT3ZIG3_9BURK|nr:2-oxo-4-hydroxy-4-carboxy-5-ureidoimidazoline decarboxylase [Robbsia betulipollinis]MCY0385773.1 2-oxo-4-hydroxy-4-carboxy-5-ureidoimidazoline decarboxylase [Robbsia betulipollinis]